MGGSPWVGEQKKDRPPAQTGAGGRPELKGIGQELAAAWLAASARAPAEPAALLPAPEATRGRLPPVRAPASVASAKARTDVGDSLVGSAFAGSGSAVSSFLAGAPLLPF